MDVKVNRVYKDRLFRLIFSSKEELLALYNAVRGTQYKDAEALEITTLDDVLYMGMKNDLSFLLDDVLNLYEHQSTYCPNMPLRGVFYLADIQEVCGCFRRGFIWKQKADAAVTSISGFL